MNRQCQFRKDCQWLLFSVKGRLVFDITSESNIALPLGCRCSRSHCRHRDCNLYDGFCLMMAFIVIMSFATIPISDSSKLAL
jgi:hypothetical protein